MRIGSVHIENFRSILNEFLRLDGLTLLVGANGAGKSTFLRALDLFYSPNPSVTSDDFYSGDLTKEIVISLTYIDLSVKAKEHFSDYLCDDELTVDMEICWSSDKPLISYHAYCLKNPDFEPIYEAGRMSKTNARTIYNELRAKDGYEDLPRAGNYDEVRAALISWEERHPDKRETMRDDGQFFGLKQVGRSLLFEHSQFLFVSGVRDASQDSSEGKGSVITRIMDLVVRNALADREDLTKFRLETQQRYEDILKPAHLTELNTLREQLTNTLRMFVPDAALELEWQPLDQLNVPMPKATVGLVEDGYRTKVEMTGHGLQRAFIFTMLQHLAMAQQTAPKPAENDARASQLDNPSLVIAIEEPELYQHPNRQRYFGRVFRRLTNGELPGVMRNIQIICATHSPLFIDVAHFDEIRLIRKELPSNKALPKVSSVFHARYKDIVAELQRLKNDPHYSVEKLKAIMPQLMTTFISEGFFADVVVLVEGETDRAAIVAVAEHCTYDLEGMGIAVVPAGGKGNIVIPAVIFRKLGIPTYLVWDCDNKTDNGELLAYVSYPINKRTRLKNDLIEHNFAAFYRTREDTMQSEIGRSAFQTLCGQCEAEIGDDNLKKPLVVQRLTTLAYDTGQKLPSIETIINSIVAMRGELSKVAT